VSHSRIETLGAEVWSNWWENLILICSRLQGCPAGCDFQGRRGALDRRRRVHSTDSQFEFGACNQFKTAAVDIVSIGETCEHNEFFRFRSQSGSYRYSFPPRERRCLSEWRCPGEAPAIGLLAFVSHNTPRPCHTSKSFILKTELLLVYTGRVRRRGHGLHLRLPWQHCREQEASSVGL
jgi:hypothetical protein